MKVTILEKNMNNLTTYWDYFLTTYAPKELSYNLSSMSLVVLAYLSAVMLLIFIFFLFKDVKHFITRRGLESDLLINMKKLEICIDVIIVCISSFYAPLVFVDTADIKNQFYTVSYPENVMKNDFQKYNLSADEVVTVMKVMEKSKTLSGEYSYLEIQNQINQHKNK